MKSNIDKVYSKLPNKKHNFKKQRVDLSLINDLEKDLIKMNNSKDKILDEGKRISEEIFNYRDVITEFNTTDFILLIGDYRSAANELGIEMDSKFEDALEEYREVKRFWADHYGIR